MGEGPPGDLAESTPATADAKLAVAATTTAATLTARYRRRTHAQRAQDVYDDHRGEHQEPDEHVRSADAGIGADNLGISAVYNAGGALLLLAVLIGCATAMTPPRPPHHA